MSQKDYVKRGRVTKKQPPEKPSNAKFKVSIAIILILGFIAILWQIKDNAPSQPIQLPTVDVVKEEPQVAEELPELPKEEWEFIRTLPGYEVEIETVEKPLSTKRYLMQCGSFRKETQAEEMRAQIAFLGMEAMVRPSDGDNGRWYRVILGPFDSKRDAERSRHSIQRAGIRTCQIWYWNL